MKRNGVILILAATLMAGFVFPLPECYLTKMTCRRMETGACPVFSSKCGPSTSTCGSGCPFSQSGCAAKKTEKRAKLLQKIKFYPVRTFIKLASDVGSTVAIAANSSSAAMVLARSGGPVESLHMRERASPIFLKNQSFLF